uniref:Uncharacterized protein n=1 Tax=Phytophthora fragariae TaxID=53985 RepID=A0A6A3EHC4_9STRA|nr:hypothetical protein PF009_g18268 [Phytophthora fragariae]
MLGQANGLFRMHSEVVLVKPATIKVFAEIAGMDIIPATKWDAAVHLFEMMPKSLVQKRQATDSTSPDASLRAQIRSPYRTA